MNISLIQDPKLWESAVASLFDEQAGGCHYSQSHSVSLCLYADNKVSVFLCGFNLHLHVFQGSVFFHLLVKFTKAVFLYWQHSKQQTSGSSFINSTSTWLNSLSLVVELWYCLMFCVSSSVCCPLASSHNLSLSSPLAISPVKGFGTKMLQLNLTTFKMIRWDSWLKINHSPLVIGKIYSLMIMMGTRLGC